MVLGHNASIFLGFRGGAGGATSVGTALALWPLGGLPALVLGVFTLFVIGYASLATILSAVSVALVFTYFSLTNQGVPVSYGVFGWAIVALVMIALRPQHHALIGRHRENVYRSLNAKGRYSHLQVPHLHPHSPNLGLDTLQVL